MREPVECHNGLKENPRTKYKPAVSKLQPVGLIQPTAVSLQPATEVWLLHF